MSGLKTDVDFSESRAVKVNVVGWVFTGIAIATVGLKVTARHMVRRLGWDDFFIFFSTGLSIIAAALVSYAVTLGLGRHTAAVMAEHGMERVSLTAKWQILGYPFNIGSFSFPNISIAILINNLLDPNPLRSRLLLGMSILQVIFAMISVFLVFLQCKPTAALWDHTIEGDCWPESVFYDFSYWVSAYTTMTDIILAIVPVSVFWKLQMPRSTKIGVCVMMSLTLLSAIVTIVKATYLPLFTNKEDPLYNVTPLVVWGLIEQNVVIVAACIPTLRPFFRQAFGSKGSSNYNNTSTGRSGGSGFRLSSKSRPKRLISATELALEDTQINETRFDPETGSNGSNGSNNSRQGIWQTREVIVETDEDAESRRLSELRKIVPSNMR
ncbi:hypothetical protein ASPSYDRAFT_39450 [Aspergillus sydowii CBS 593.65]|uniref:Rhodopsin domain-containing protein n=1 Tax=Aspergillus sydowii CBS 593.65 TaxID=1036612 RepID=A0A1L9TZ62_9EURO|nr:uncharacterized protein ASPSYDRAFT_39450 [Aspergillus sydowii CBS 593.65]OJJ64699.1 hypothetical protein ASPSYDRAFT_39450 [Aspergillus sydowii CBS 593.65]